MDKKKTARMTRIRAVTSKISDGIASQAESACKVSLSLGQTSCQHQAAATFQCLPEAATASLVQEAAKAVRSSQASAAA
jgi:hypothetical protein